MGVPRVWPAQYVFHLLSPAPGVAISGVPLHSLLSSCLIPVAHKFKSNQDETVDSWLLADCLPDELLP